MPVAVPRFEVFGDLADVLAAVEDFCIRDRPLAAEEFSVAGGDGLAEEPYLVPPIVEVVLPRYPPPRSFEDSRERVPIRRVASMCHSHRSRGVKTHVLEQDRLTRRLPPPVSVSRYE